MHRLEAIKMETGNLYQNIPPQLPDEISDSLLHGKGIKIERIVSRGQHSPAGFWYDQTYNEWVLLIKGEARLRFEEGNEIIHLTAGVYVNIPAHARHRIESTTDIEETIWLAVFY